MGARHAPVCFVTAATESFVPGTLVTICSFLKHHPAFDGDVVVIHDALPASQRRCLQDACGKVRFEPVSPELRERLATLGAVQPRLAARLGEFYSLEAFRLRGYRKVLFYDSDVLFRAPVDELFHSPALLLCRSDEACLRGLGRDAASFEAVPPGAGALENTFGSGFLAIDARLAEQEGCHADLLALVQPDTWRDRPAQHTDQLVLNRYFAGRQTLVDWRYDFVVPMAAEIHARQGWAVEDAKALHFAGPVKPWMPQAMLRWTRGDAAFKPSRAYGHWTEAYVDCLARAHVRSARERLHGKRGRPWRESA